MMVEVLLKGIVLLLSMSLIICCTEKSEVEDWSQRLETSSRSMRVFMKYCGEEYLPRAQLIEAESCSYKRQLVS